jgi:hypothetical protein
MNVPHLVLFYWDPISTHGATSKLPMIMEPSLSCSSVPPELFIDRWMLLGEPHKTGAMEA